MTTVTAALVAVRPSVAAGVTALLAVHDRRVATQSISLSDIVPGVPSQVDVVLLATGSTAIEDDARLGRIVEVRPSPPVMVFSDLDDDARALSCLRRGAAAYLLSDNSGEELVAAIERVAAGQTFLDPAIGGRIGQQLAHGTWRDTPRLTGWDLRPRERQVLESLLEGRTNREIAGHLNLGEETIKTYLRSLYRKLGARDRTQAIAIALGRRS